MRIFVAVVLDDAVKNAMRMAQDSLARRCSEVRWVAPALLHLTVKFLGDTPDGRVAEVCDAVAEAIEDAAPFRLRIGACGCFPPRGPVRIVWAGAKEESGILGACAERIEVSLEAIGVARERRPFSAHVTLGRVREDRSDGRIRSRVEAYSFAPIDQTVSAITVMSSVLSPKGPTYTTVAALALGEARDLSRQ